MIQYLACPMSDFLDPVKRTEFEKRVADYELEMHHLGMMVQPQCISDGGVYLVQYLVAQKSSQGQPLPCWPEDLEVARAARAEKLERRRAAEEKMKRGAI